jgi:hypothetical protein
MLRTHTELVIEKKFWSLILMIQRAAIEIKPKSWHLTVLQNFNNPNGQPIEVAHNHVVTHLQWLKEGVEKIPHFPPRVLCASCSGVRRPCSPLVHFPSTVLELEVGPSLWEVELELRALGHAKMAGPWLCTYDNTEMWRRWGRPSWMTCRKSGGLRG